MWEEERFQPVLKYLNSLRDEAIYNFATLELKQSGEDCKARMAVAKTQYRFSNLILNLPKAIKDTEVLQEKQAQKVTAFANSQEGGTL